MHPERQLLPYPSVSDPAPGRTRPGSAQADDPDLALVRAMAAGDERALGLLYDRWQPLLHSLIFHVVGDAGDAEEVLEDALWQAWRQAGTYDESRGSVRTWLTTIARSRALDRVRVRRAARQDVSLDDAPASAEFVLAGGGPAEAAEAADLRARVEQALALLPPDQRETVELAYFRGLSQTEIAEATGQPLGTVKTRARLALQKLRTALSSLREEAP